jgi:hypothetical protein
MFVIASNRLGWQFMFAIIALLLRIEYTAKLTDDFTFEFSDTRSLDQLYVGRLSMSISDRSLHEY